MIMKGSISRRNKPVAVVDRDGKFEKVNGLDVSTMAYELNVERRKARRELISTVLLDTTGGYVLDGSPLVSAVSYLAYEDIPSTAFVDSQALSYGGSIFAICYPRIVGQNSRVMFHQVYYNNVNQKGEAKRPKLYHPRDQFRSWLKEWLTDHTDSGKEAWALERAEAAFRDPKNHLDDVNFWGWELEAAGLANKAVLGRGSLALAYAKTTRSDPVDWPVQVRCFFKI